MRGGRSAMCSTLCHFRMLNLRLYRAAWLPVLFCLAVVAFSLHARPRGIATTLAPDAFDGPNAARLLEGLATAFPDRRPGSAGDDGLAERVRVGFGPAFGGGRVRGGRGRGGASGGRRVRERTIDGRRELRTVIAERPGRSLHRIVILAHRDAAAGTSKADLSAPPPPLPL